jgi:hypothetical protein
MNQPPAVVGEYQPTRLVARSRRNDWEHPNVTDGPGNQQQFSF